VKAEESEIRRKRRVLEHATESGNVAKTCRYFGVPRSSFYRWRDAYQEHGEEGLRCKKSIAKSHPNQTPDEIVEKILHLRRKYHPGPVRIMWYMARYHQMRVSDATIYRVLKRHGISRLPGKVGCQKVHTKRYNKQVPGHHIQMDVKFLIFRSKAGKKIKRYQYTAIDDATRVRALKIYNRHTQKNAIAFVDHIIAKFPFRIQQIRTDRGHEFQAQFYQLLSYKDDVDLNKKLDEWEQFYKFARPHGAHQGRTPYESLREKLT
jgi:transposase InsO family protein